MTQIALRFLISLGIPPKRLRLRVNSIGSLETRKRYYSALVKYLYSNLKSLAPLDVEQVQRDAFRVLNTKEEKTLELLSRNEFPLISDFLTRDENLEYLNFRGSLRYAEGDVVIEDPTLIHGLDYCNDRVFEITTDLLESQNTLISGGQHDTLVETLGGPPTKAFGWVGGVERIALAIEKVRQLQSS